MYDELLYEFRGVRPKVGTGCFIASSAEIIGDVTIGDESYIGLGAKIIADYGRIRIGSRTAIEECAILHVRPDKECIIGDYVTVGHEAILHTCVVGNYAVIGMGAVVSDFSTVGEWSVVGEGAVVVSGSNIPSHKVAVGVPASSVKDISEDWKELWTRYKSALPVILSDLNSSLKEVKLRRLQKKKRRGGI